MSNIILPYQVTPKYTPTVKGTEILRNKGRSTPITPYQGKNLDYKNTEQILTIWIGQESLRIPLNPYPNTGRELYTLITNHLNSIQDPRGHLFKERRLRNSARTLIPNSDDPLVLLPDMTLTLMSNTTFMLA